MSATRPLLAQFSGDGVAHAGSVFAMAIAVSTVLASVGLLGALKMKRDGRPWSRWVAMMLASALFFVPGFWAFIVRYAP